MGLNATTQQQLHQSLLEQVYRHDCASQFQVLGQLQGAMQQVGNLSTQQVLQYIFDNIRANQ